MTVTHGLEQMLAEIEHLPTDLWEGFCRDMADFLDGLISHDVLDDGHLVVAHAGMKASLQGRASPRVREFTFYGETTGETDTFGLPIRNHWAGKFRGRAFVVYSHTPVPEAEWLNRTVNIDTGDTPYRLEEPAPQALWRRGGISRQTAHHHRLGGGRLVEKDHLPRDEDDYVKMGLF